jgi:ABC-type bacteriocin/lantibiotic exporter with double-glycine peptidase domain
MSITPITPYKRLVKLLKPDSREIANIYIFAVFNGLIALSLPIGIQAIINLIQGGRINTSWIVLVGFVLVGIALSGVMQIYQLRITENLQQKIFTRAAFDFIYRIPRIKMEELYRYYVPELMNRFFDTLNLQKGLSKLLIDISSSALQVLFGLILLSLYHPFFIIFSLVLLLLVYAIFKFTAPLGLKTSINESSYKYKVAYWLEEVARTHTTFKLAGKTKMALNKIDSHVYNYLEQRESHFKILLSQYILMIAFKVLVAAGLLIIGGLLVMEQRMNIGQFVAAEIIIIMVLASVEKLILSLETIYDVLTSLDKLGMVVDLELESEGGDDIAAISNCDAISVDIRNLSFSYQHAAQSNINKLSLTINKSERILISGSSGSGKSTLLHLIAGLYTVDHGNLFYNDVDICNLNLIALRSKIGDCISQEQVFHGSIYDNITLHRENIDKEYLNKAIKTLYLNNFINNQTKSFDSIIQPEGKKLPQSITKKIILARCIADKPGLLLLEEPFVGIAPEEQAEIIDFILAKNMPWTVIISSSNKDIIKYIDREVILKNGEIEKIINHK